MLSTIGTISNSNITSSSLSHNYQQSPAEVIGNLDDLLTEILLRLPIKSLLKFKSVSKHWLSLISNPVFCHRLSLTRNQSQAFLFIVLLSKSVILNMTSSTLIPIPLVLPSELSPLLILHMESKSCNLVMVYYYVAVDTATTMFIIPLLSNTGYFINPALAEEFLDQFLVLT
ncbi:hypothetical protein AB3S75_047707 [Citrus x aurantiifolia]